MAEAGKVVVPVVVEVPVVLEVLAERRRQVDLGWSAQHDDDEGVHHLLRLADERLDHARIRSLVPGARRRWLIQTAALLVAAVECHDREQSRG